MSRGFPPAGQLQSAVLPQTNQTIAQTGAVANQAVSNANQAEAIRSRERMQREQNEIAQMMGGQKNAVAMAGIAERSRSQAEYRNLLAEKANVEASMARDFQNDKNMQYQQEVDFEKSQYQEMLDRQDEIMEISLAASEAEGEALELHQRKLQDLREKQSAHSLAITKAKEIQRTGMEDLTPMITGMIESAQEQRDGAAMVSDRIGAGLADVLTGEGIVGKEGLRDILGIDTGSFGLGASDLASFLNPARLFYDDPNAVQTRALQALGVDFFQGGFIGPGVIDAAAREAGAPEALGSGKIKENFHRRIATQISSNYTGLNTSQQAELQSALIDAFQMSGNDSKSVKAARAVLSQKINDINTKAGPDGGQINDLILNTVIAGIGEKLKADRLAMGGVPNDYDDVVATEDQPFEDAVNEFIMKKIVSVENTQGIIGLGATGETVNTLDTFIGAMQSEIDRDELRIPGLMDILDQDGFDFGTEDDDLLSAMGVIEGQEDDMEDLIRERNLMDTMSQDLINRSEIEMGTSRSGETEARRDILERRRARRAGS
tara:strand:- start:3332 stop:4975 length:1644 start_codon:yes stop_codon:yes gene_type:complete